MLNSKEIQAYVDLLDFTSIREEVVENKNCSIISGQLINSVLKTLRII